MWIPDNPFTQDARDHGYDLSSNYSLAPHVLATFGYWVDEHFELSLEGGYHYDAIGAKGGPGLTINAETVMATVRYVFLTSYDIWPYVGGSFGWAFNEVNSPFNFAWGGCSTGCNSWNAVGYAEAGEIGAGWDLSENVGVTAELRFTFDLLQSPLPSAINAAGLSLMVGVYLRIPRSADSAMLPAGP
jgi:hypothetical protein